LRPAWEEHISVVRDEEPPNKEFWEKYAGQEIEFQYNPIVEGDGLFFWLNVDCDFLLEIREELGLPRDPEFPLHLTIGNAKNEDA
jgi:hypothetical protein